VDQELKKLCATKGLCQIYHNIDYAVGKDKLTHISLVIAPNHRGGSVECMSKEDMEDACTSAKANNSSTNPMASLLWWHHLRFN
jgi:hypothetical protein